MAAVVKIRVKPNLTVLVDAKDAEEVKDYRWYVSKASGGRFYVQASVYDKKKGTNRSVQLARLIARPRRDQLVIFKNENHLDFRRENLLKVDQAYVIHHARKKHNSSSSYKGVYFQKRKWYTKRWTARIRFGDKRIDLGRYKTEEEAAKAYDKAALQYFDRAARLNFPEKFFKENQRRKLTASKKKSFIQAFSYLRNVLFSR